MLWNRCGPDGYPGSVNCRTTLAACLLALSGISAIRADGIAPRECLAKTDGELDFGTPMTLSDPLSAAFMPAVAARQSQVLITWQETGSKANRVAFAIATGGCVGPVRRVEDPMPNPRRPAAAATASGWVLAYEARDTPRPLIRSIRLDWKGEIISGPETVSEPGEVASRVGVAANGDDVVFTWTDVMGHHLARTGPVEELPPTTVGTRLAAAGLVNYPKVAIDGEGTIYLAYRDGGPERTDFEVRLLSRKVGERFSRPVNVSRSRGLMSDDVALAVESDGRLRLVWVEQDAERPETFEVVHATLDRSLTLSEPARFGTLGQASFRPTVVGGLATVWQVGTTRSGRLYFADEALEPVQILSQLVGGMAALAEDATGNLHLAFVDTQSPPRLRYAWRTRTR